jgi:hypothetical protein
LGAVNVELTTDDLIQLDAATATVRVHGSRGTGDEQYL